MIFKVSFLFFGCSSLKELPDISIWNISKITRLDLLFGKCSSLKSLPDISKWNTKNIRLLNGLFYKCKSLEILPDISKWNITNVFALSFLFYECSSLKQLPDLSKWNIDNVINLNCTFYKCSSLIYLPDISKWNIFSSNINNYISFLYSIGSLKEEVITKLDDINDIFIMLNDEYNNDLYLEDFKIHQNPFFKPNSFNKEGSKYLFLLNTSYSMNCFFAGCSSL